MSGLEVAGLAVGVVGLIALFKECVDALSLISAARSKDRDFAILGAKLDLEKAQILSCAQRVRLTESNYDRRLDDPTCREAVDIAIRSICGLFDDAIKLRDQYGIAEVDTDDVALVAYSVSGSRLRAFNAAFSRLNIRDPPSSSLKQKCKWAIRDKNKFEVLLSHISFFADKLARLVPGSESAEHEELLRAIRAIQPLEQTRVLLDACSGRLKKFEQTAQTAHVEKSQKVILDTLWFRSMDERRDSLSAPHPRTFEWIFQPLSKIEGCSDFPAWLTSDAGIYWISGKPAAGKSTLMKYILNHPATIRGLKKWASPSTVSVHSFFLRGLGHPDQRSWTGLARALLYNILSADPEDIANLLPAMWKEVYAQALENPSLPNDTEVRGALQALAGVNMGTMFCFIIDGLDEYEGDYRKAIDLIELLAAAPIVKVVISSRHNAAFWSAFSVGPMLRLERLNRPDIAEYVQGQLTSHESMVTLLARHTDEANSILEELVGKAHGVFLWVVVACRSLIQGLEGGDFISELRERIVELPPELEDLFAHIMSNLEKRHRTEALRLVELVYRSQVHHQEDAMLFAYAIGVLTKHDFTLPSGMLSTPSEAFEMQETMERRLRSRCCGLLELDTLCGSKKAHIRFLHRTLFEYLRASMEISPRFFSEIACDFDAPAALAAHWLLQLADDLYFQHEDVSATESRVHIYIDHILYFCACSKPESQKIVCDVLSNMLRHLDQRRETLPGILRSLMTDELRDRSWSAGISSDECLAIIEGVHASMDQIRRIKEWTTAPDSNSRGNESRKRPADTDWDDAPQGSGDRRLVSTKRTRAL